MKDNSSKAIVLEDFHRLLNSGIFKKAMKTFLADFFFAGEGSGVYTVIFFLIADLWDFEEHILSFLTLLNFNQR